MVYWFSRKCNEEVENGDGALPVLKCRSQLPTQENKGVSFCDPEESKWASNSCPLIIGLHTENKTDATFCTPKFFHTTYQIFKMTNLSHVEVTYELYISKLSEEAFQNFGNKIFKTFLKQNF